MFKVGHLFEIQNGLMYFK